MNIWGVVTHHHTGIAGNRVPSNIYRDISLGMINGERKPIKTHMCRKRGSNNGRMDMPAMRMDREKRVRLTAVRYIRSMGRIWWPTII